MKVLVFVFGLLLTSGCLLAQSILIKGKVTDAETGNPVANASIYLNGTQAGTTAGKDGSFSFSALKTNSPLVVSCIGYVSQEITDYQNKSVNVSLKHKDHQLKEVTIGKSNRAEEMKIFLREFIGQDYKNCVISNPDDIRLEYNKKRDSLVAECDEPLIIYNKELGYKLTYFLASFSYRPAETSYTGNYFFAEDTAGIKPAIKKQLLVARDMAYFGSRMHFIRALWANALMQNSFRISGPVKKYVDPDDLEAVKKGITYDNIVHVKNDNRFTDQKYLALKSLIFIGYQNQTSQVKPKKGYEGTLIDSNGYYSEGLIWSGDMGASRIGKLLPYEFLPHNVR